MPWRSHRCCRHAAVISGVMWEVVRWVPLKCRRLFANQVLLVAPRLAVNHPCHIGISCIPWGGS